MSRLQELMVELAWRTDDILHRWTASFPPYERSHLGRCLYMPNSLQFSNRLHPFHIAASYGLMCMLDHPRGSVTLHEQDLNARDGQDCTPLIWAATNRNMAVTKWLLDHPAVDPNAQNSDGRSALTIASENGFDDVVELLIARRDLDVNLRDAITLPDHYVSFFPWSSVRNRPVQPCQAIRGLIKNTTEVQCTRVGGMEWARQCSPPSLHKI